MKNNFVPERQETSSESPSVDKKRVLPGRRRRHGRRRLASTAALPALLTVLNGLAGFASIHFATKDALGHASLFNLQVAGWLIFAAMVFDMLDGRIARVTRQTSEFGEQLDSLCDMVSFGVAVIMVLRGHVERIDVLSGGLTLERVIWCVAGLYVACAALRLARFNVETDPDESAHMSFRGLPSPGAAAAVAAMVLLFVDLAPLEEGWRSSTWILLTTSITLPVVTLAVALLMVSAFRYPHVVNQYIRSKRQFGFLVKLVLLVLATILVGPFSIVAVLAVAYALAGPLQSISKRMRKGHRTPAPPST
ncbi:MAG: CDP-diacylglycerol--serine O-phosphatidyltransferase [Planctomycetota bacterium]|jgi:CDP-diacylglycerol--serine O-phosphatidyltransferase